MAFSFEFTCLDFIIPSGIFELQTLPIIEHGYNCVLLNKYDKAMLCLKKIVLMNNGNLYVPLQQKGLFYCENYGPDVFDNPRSKVKIHFLTAKNILVHDPFYHAVLYYPTEIHYLRAYLSGQCVFVCPISANMRMVNLDELRNDRNSKVKELHAQYVYPRLLEYVEQLIPSTFLDDKTGESQ